MLSFPSIPPPMGWSCDPWTFSFWKIAAAEPCEITFEETELLSFLRQNIIHCLCKEAERQGLSLSCGRVASSHARDPAFGRGAGYRWSRFSGAAWSWSCALDSQLVPPILSHAHDTLHLSRATAWDRRELINVWSVRLSLTPLWQSGQAEAALYRGAASSGSCEDGLHQDPTHT